MQLTKVGGGQINGHRAEVPLEPSGDAGQRILAYTAEPGSPSHERLGLLASWAATPKELATTEPDER